MSISSMRGRWGARLRTRFSLLSLSLGIAFGAVPLAVTPLVVSADAPTGIGFTLLGCRGSESLLLASGPYLCPDADYTDGNQGKDWNELDLVPFRLVATANGSAPATQTYDVATVADYLGVFGKNSYPGFDYMSVPVLNTTLSDASCAAVSSNPAAGPGATLATATGDTSLYRLLSVTQAKGTTCVYDYYQRLALGSSAFPGSALHSFLGTATVSSGGTVSDLDRIPGVKTIPLPVNPTTPPSLSASLSATQGAGYVWTVGKSATPNPVSMSNTCNPDARSVNVDVTLTWTRQQVDQGSTVVVESVYADNPTGRAFTASATATLLDASNAQVAQDSTGNVTVPANSSHYLLGSFTHNETAGASSSYTTNVSGGYTDPVTHQSVGDNPMTASATANVGTVVSGSNANAVVTDVAGISGAGLAYSIDSVTGPAGSFGAYVPGTPTTGSVTWTSPSLSGDGSAVLHETVYATGAVAGSGSLDDQAHVTSGEITTGINLQVPVSTAALFDLTIHKTIPDVLQGEQTASFGFTVTDAHGNSTPASIDFGAGQTSGSTGVTGLAAGTYTVHETAQNGWAVQPDQTVVAAVPTCSYTVNFANSIVPAVAAVQKTTIPAGHQAGWQFTLTGPGLPAAGETATTNATGALAFSTPLQEGEYQISETSVRSGWVQGASRGCGFSVDYPADAGRTFTCDVTNVQGVVSTPVTGPQGGVQAAHVTTPDTGAGLPYLEALLLVLAGGGLAAWGWLHSRRNRRPVLR